MQVEAVRRLVRDEGGSMSTPPLKMRNIGPKSAAWLRQVGLRTPEDLAEAGPLEAFMRVKRAGFKPSLNLLHALEGAPHVSHWQQVPDERRVELAEPAAAETAGLPPTRNRPHAGPGTTPVLPPRDSLPPHTLFTDTDDSPRPAHRPP